MASAETFAAVLVKAAGLPVQSALNCPGTFVTLTVTVQDEGPARTCRLLTAIVLPPAVAVVAAAAFAHVPPKAGGFPTTRPDGRVSVKPIFDSAGLPPGLVTVNIRTVVPPPMMVVGEKTFVRVTAEAATTRQLGTTPFKTLASPVTFTAVLVKAAGLPAQLALVCAATFVTLTVTVQDEEPAGTCRLLTVIVLVPEAAIVAAAAFTHVPPTALGLPTMRPDGRVSVKPTFDTPGLPDVLVTVNVRTVVPPPLMVVGEKTFVTVGGLPPANAGAGIATATRNARQTPPQPWRSRAAFMTRILRAMLLPARSDWSSLPRYTWLFE